jgi:hypothetical protein
VQQDGEWGRVGSEDDNFGDAAVERLCDFVGALERVSLVSNCQVVSRSQHLHASARSTHLLELPVVRSLLREVQQLLLELLIGERESGVLVRHGWMCSKLCAGVSLLFEYRPVSRCTAVEMWREHLICTWIQGRGCLRFLSLSFALCA